MAFGYSLLRGRDGAAGVIRTQDGGRHVTLRGMKPGEACEVFALNDGGAAPLGKETADRAGQVSFKCPGDGALFVVSGGRVRLWEGGEEAYARAAAWLLEEKRKEEKKTERRAEEPEEPPPQESAEEKESAPPERRSEDITERGSYSLRKPSAEEPVDALPELLWPGASREIKEYFDRYPPCAPLPLPGWRFVKAPSLRATAPFIAVGRLARDGAVRRIAYAMPGDRRMPAQRPDARFFKGADGWDYWVTFQDV